MPFQRYGIVAGGDLNSAGGAALAHEQRKRGSGARLRRRARPECRSRKQLRRRRARNVRSRSACRSRPARRARLFGAHHVARDGVRDFADVLVREILGDDAAPAVGAKFDCAHGKQYKRSDIAGGKQLSGNWWFASDAKWLSCYKQAREFLLLRAISRFCRRPGRGRAGRAATRRRFPRRPDRGRRWRRRISSGSRNNFRRRRA